MCIQGGVCAFSSCHTLVSLAITLVRETPTEMSSLPLCLALEVHSFLIVYYKLVLLVKITKFFLKC